MALSVVAQPDTLSYSKNPVLLMLQSNAFITTAGIKFHEVITITDVVSDDDTFIFAYGAISVVFTAATSPDDSGLQFASASDPTTRRNNLYNAMLANYNLYRDFDIKVVLDSGTDPAIDVMAKAYGSSYTIDHTGSTMDFATEEVVSGVDIGYAENFKAIVDLYIENDGSTDEIPTFDRIDLSQVPDGSSQVFFDLKDILDSYVCKAFAGETGLYTWVTSSIIARETIMIRSFYFRYAEQYGDPAATKKMTQTTPAWVICGGADPDMFSISPNFLALRYLGTEGNIPFMTWCPNNKLINLNQYERLYICLNPSQSGDAVRLKANLYYGNGAVDEDVEFDIDDYDLPQIPQVISIPANALIIHADNAQDLVKYDIYLDYVSSSLPYSEVRTFIIDTRCYFNEKYFLFQNSLGGLDTLRATGDRLRGVVVNAEVFEAIIPLFDYDPIRGKQGLFAARATDVFKMSTGFHSKEYIEYLAKELLLSNHVWEMSPDLIKTFIPIIINTRSITFLSDSKDQFSFTFEYQFAYTTPVYSPLTAPFP